MNYLFYNDLHAAHAFLILHGHFYVECVSNKLYVNVWNTQLNDSLEVALHPDDVRHYANEFRLLFGREIHKGNFAELLDPLHDLDELAVLYRVGLIEEAPKYLLESEYK